MGDFVTSHIRTWVPIIVGSLVTFLADKLGIVLSSDAAAGAVVFLTALLSGVYYLIARLLESKWPSLGWLLGSPKPPAYQAKPAA